VAVEPPPDLLEVLTRFGLSVGVDVRPHPGGHINASYRVTRTGGTGGREYLLQRLNPNVFADGGQVMRNFSRITTHLESAVARSGLSDAGRRVLRLLPSLEGEPAIVARDGAWWRLLRFIPRARMIERVEAPSEAREVGAAFGSFHRLLADYGGHPLEVTIPDFHDTGKHLLALEEAIRRNPAGRVAAATEEIAFAHGRMPLADLLPRPGEGLGLGIVHNDAKPANVLLDEESGAGLAVVDLDTVMPGTVLHDIGDLIRSTSCPAPEDERDLAQMRVEPSLFLALASGFLSAGGARVLGDAERAWFVAAGLVITYEQGVRFLTDYLTGDVYYRISRPGQNLERARAQFRLVESLEQLRGDLERTISDLTHSLWP
jgi:hypothetical protein